MPGAAHGVVHGDVKPAHSFLPSGRGDPIARVDFELPKIDASSALRVELERDLAWLGSEALS